MIDSKATAISAAKNMKEITLREHLTRIGRITSPRKAASSRENGKLGGRPSKSKKTKRARQSKIV